LDPNPPPPCAPESPNKSLEVVADPGPTPSLPQVGLSSLIILNPDKIRKILGKKIVNIEFTI
jgi:hypothetical protein